MIEIEVTQEDQEGFIICSPVGIEVYREIPRTEEWEDNLRRKIKSKRDTLDYLYEKFWEIKVLKCLNDEKYLPKLSIFWWKAQPILIDYLEAEIIIEGDTIIGKGPGGGIILFEVASPVFPDLIYKYLSLVFGSPEFREHLLALKEYENI